MQNLRTIGAHAESLARTYLTQQGYTPITQNYHARIGEIDIICKDQNTYIFIEVKYRKNSKYGTAIEGVTPLKFLRMQKAAQHWLINNKLNDVPCRFDIIAIDGPHLTHEKGVG